ncbi:adenosylcobyric acid synthase [Amycolatopsis mediterranei S699]|uniref:Cobyric acid synthase n=2 Tax=Amycolatopsis mediterranei TaxID=33910 RepID=A0A0H3DEY1_AMYMU|nr:cobyric acid synthase [Amycolatopsis mediterranei]ADJ48762.1 adenosylcobyric acid synthase [Amycolatopsis mediterranei U32]AEK45702.1 cobyric acid synthase [Amycolatopsis mediterranei S699]AFO80471.1 adenosylcobyric acid synthase [Amycolatopsis mediterranei S699]AGT87599.1 adenosylcobyric acid synthase [Amycolatopsis mediterranei RB]KDO03979.1 cobalamin biosynthesis protein CobQ [Amycolatopsis mediterranei]
MSGLLVAGTTSDAGKSLVTAGICRWLARRGVQVAPFKAQNMSNNSMVCADGAEIGRAQWVQARAAGVEPEAAMNPVLLKPGSDRRSHVVALGKPFGTLEAGEYATGRAGLAEIAFGAFEDLSARFDVVVCEGAGSPAEINLRGGDYVNMGLARRFGLPVLVVGDIDRGGVLAAMFGTLALLSAEDQALVAGWVVNKFRGDVGLLRPGLDSLENVTGRPVLGVLPWLDRVWIDSEDALAVAGWRRETPGGRLGVAVVRFPRTSNATDVDALAAEPGVTVTLTADPDVVAAADVVVLPGSRATVADLAWLRERGLDTAVTARAAAGRPVLGICGGYQMLTESIVDEFESGAGEVAGLGLLPGRVTFAAEKVLARPAGTWRGHPVDAYEIHHGSVIATTSAESFLDGRRAGAVWGTMWHGAFENDAFRRAWLTEAAAQAGTGWTPAPDAPGFGDLREEMLDKLADAVDEHLDTELLRTLLDRGAPPDLPFVPPGAP